MSTKQTQKTVKLYEVLIFLLITIAAMLLVGLMTRDSESQRLKGSSQIEESVQSKLLFMESQRLYLTSTIANTFDSVSRIYIHAINEVKIAKLQEIEEVKEVEAQRLAQSPYNLYNLYNRYVDDIITNYYPSLDPELVKAIIYHESRYDPTVTNATSGATGLMQIDPKWHTQRALSLGVSDLYDPYGNILVGCDLLNELIEDYDYDYDYALNFYAGGYPYANAYATSTSPYVLELYDIIDSFRSGAIDREFGGD